MEVHTFPKFISPKVNVIVRLTFELVVLHVRHGDFFQRRGGELKVEREGRGKICI